MKSKPLPPGWTKLKGKKGNVDIDVQINTNDFQIIEKKNNNTHFKLKKKGG